MDVSHRQLCPLHIDGEIDAGALGQVLDIAVAAVFARSGEAAGRNSAASFSKNPDMTNKYGEKPLWRAIADGDAWTMPPTSVSRPR
jgi:hypothetical protein